MPGEHDFVWDPSGKLAVCNICCVSLADAPKEYICDKPEVDEFKTKHHFEWSDVSANFQCRLCLKEYEKGLKCCKFLKLDLKAWNQSKRDFAAVFHQDLLFDDDGHSWMFDGQKTIVCKFCSQICSLTPEFLPTPCIERTEDTRAHFWSISRSGKVAICRFCNQWSHTSHEMPETYMKSCPLGFLPGVKDEPSQEEIAKGPALMWQKKSSKSFNLHLAHSQFAVDSNLTSHLKKLVSDHISLGDITTSHDFVNVCSDEKKLCHVQTPPLKKVFMVNEWHSWNILSGDQRAICEYCLQATSAETILPCISFPHCELNGEGLRMQDLMPNHKFSPEGQFCKNCGMSNMKVPEEQPLWPCLVAAKSLLAQSILAKGLEFDINWSSSKDFIADENGRLKPRNTKKKRKRASQLNTRSASKKKQEKEEKATEEVPSEEKVLDGLVLWEPRWEHIPSREIWQTVISQKSDFREGNLPSASYAECTVLFQTAEAAIECWEKWTSTLAKKKEALGGKGEKKTARQTAQTPEAEEEIDLQLIMHHIRGPKMYIIDQAIKDENEITKKMEIPRPAAAFILYYDPGIFRCCIDGLSLDHVSCGRDKIVDHCGSLRMTCRKPCNVPFHVLRAKEALKMTHSKFAAFCFNATTKKESSNKQVEVLCVNTTADLIPDEHFLNAGAIQVHM